MAEQKLTVLLIDDDPDFLELTKEILMDSDKFRVFTASSGMEGFAKVRNLNIDLMISDVRMPKMTGIELFEAQMRTKALSKVPVLFVTGLPEQVSQAVLSRPLTEVLAKPFEEQELIQRALALVKKRKIQEIGSTAVDAKIMDAFIQSTVLAMKGLLKVNKCEQGKLFLLNPELNLALEVTAAVSLNEKNFHGNLMLSFPRKTLNKVLANQQVQIESHERIMAKAQELTFMVWQTTVETLKESNEGLKKIVPQVVSGGPQNINSSSGAPLMVIPFMTEFGEFYAMFSIEVVSQKLAA